MTTAFVRVVDPSTQMTRKWGSTSATTGATSPISKGMHLRCRSQKRLAASPEPRHDVTAMTKSDARGGR